MNRTDFPSYTLSLGRWTASGVLEIEERKMRKGGPLVTLAAMLAVAVTAFTLGSASRVQAEPPNPCHYGFCEE
jgi:hypothetical protein